MTTLDHATPMTHSAARPAAVVRLINAVSNFYRAMKNRREIYKLGEMTDAELSDIGLRRGDLHVAVMMPFGTDPTIRLGAIARANRIEDMARRVC